VGDWTGTVPSYASGDEVPASKMQIETAIEAAVTGLPTTWTPTLANLTQGNGTIIAKYRRAGKWVDFRFKFTLGSTSAVGTTPQFTLPAAPSVDYLAANDVIGGGQLLHTGVTNRQASPVFIGGSTLQIQFWNATPATASVTATVPWTWGTGDYLDCFGTYYTD